MATSSFNKTFVIRDDKTADVLLEAAKTASTRPPLRKDSFQFADKETVVKKKTKR